MHIKILEYVDRKGQSPFQIWFIQLKSPLAAKLSTVLYRMEQGNFSNIKSIGENVFENKINIGPGYRIYFAQDGEDLIILLGAGSKKNQSKDILNAKSCWKDYKYRKKQENDNGTYKKL